MTALRTITTPVSVAAIAFGAPYPCDTQKALWIVGNHGRVFALWRIRNLTTLTVEGPFTMRPAALSCIPSPASLSAHETEHGRLGIAYNSMGHGQGRYVP